ncbi:PAAR domain-containing protein [Burkholderia sp. COPS]|uniref:PAAR domain-containing protein n=1 Tax=Burkholderia sp. COPS TaxID=2597663 RepID=UPI002155C391|nr:PAAR domain-containing protein [Burkholderia sp. COPS]
MKDELKAPTYLFATVGALTERGGRVTAATSGLTLAGLEVACVGDVVTYDDGSEAAIIDGAGNNHSGGKPFALVGSRLSNGDRITETLRTSWGMHVRDGQSAAGLFDPTYVPPPAPPAYRLAVRGATTARGGALREPSGTWEVAPHLGRAATVGDLIHYPDG